MAFTKLDFPEALAPNIAAVFVRDSFDSSPMVKMQSQSETFLSRKGVATIEKVVLSRNDRKFANENSKSIIKLGSM